MSYPPSYLRAISNSVNAKSSTAIMKRILFIQLFHEAIRQLTSHWCFLFPASSLLFLCSFQLTFNLPLFFQFLLPLFFAFSSNICKCSILVSILQDGNFEEADFWASGEGIWKNLESCSVDKGMHKQHCHPHQMHMHLPLRANDPLTHNKWYYEFECCLWYILLCKEMWSLIDQCHIMWTYGRVWDW